METQGSSKSEREERKARIAKRRQALREARLQHPREHIGCANGRIIFKRTGEPVPGSPIIKKPNKAQIKEVNSWSR